MSKEWDYNKNKKITPLDVLPNSNKKFWWKCHKNHEWIATVNDRSNDHGCPKCQHYVELKNGIFCNSITEAYYYLQLKKRKIKFKHNDFYDKMKFGKHRYDFYLTKENKYIEITSFTKRYKRWKQYLKTINLKRQFCKKIGARFEFIQIDLTKKQRHYTKSKLLEHN